MEEKYYFKRENSELGNFYDVFNKIMFNLDEKEKEKINIYFKKYYGYSNIFEINLDSYNLNDISFITKPIKTYEKEKSILNQLLTLTNNKFYSGYLDYQSLYDIYIDIEDDINDENQDRFVKMQKEDNPLNNLMKLFKPNIKYILDFEVEHLIKLDPNFNANIIIKDSEHNITLDKSNQVTTEIKGKNVEITTDSNAILYFYNTISSLTSKSEIYKNMFQHEIEPSNEKNLLLDIKLIGDYRGELHYLIDVGFEGYAPFEYYGFDLAKETCYGECTLVFPNYYDKIKTELVEGEKIFVYYYIDSDNPYNITTELNPKYYSSLKNINNKYTFLVVPPNIEGEEEKNLFINFYDKKAINLQVHYCSKYNYDENKPTLNYYQIGRSKSTKEFDDQEIFSIEYWVYKLYRFYFTSKNEFVFSYFFTDKYDSVINSDSAWYDERKVSYELIIKKAEINFETNMAKIQAIPNYLYSSTKYFIIIGPKNDNFNLESFNDPCILVKLITENSTGVIIYETMNIGDEYIDVDIDLTDLISQNLENKDLIVNIFSL